MGLINKLIERSTNKLGNNFHMLSDVRAEDCIPLRTENNLTAWKFSFSDKVLWLPSGTIENIVDYGILFRLMLTITPDYSMEYDVYGDDTGMSAVALNMSTDISFSEENSCIEQNLDTVELTQTQIDSTKSKTCGIFFGYDTSSTIDDRGYGRVYTIVRGSVEDITMYMLMSMMNHSSKTSNYIIDNVWLCNDYALLRYKRIENADHGQQ